MHSLEDTYEMAETTENSDSSEISTHYDFFFFLLIEKLSSFYSFSLN